MSLGIAPQHLISGWVSCALGREELVAVTIEQRDAVLAGVIPCPACHQSCGVTFTADVLSEDMQVVRWRDGQWFPGFFLR